MIVKTTPGGTHYYSCIKCESLFSYNDEGFSKCAKHENWCPGIVTPYSSLEEKIKGLEKRIEILESGERV